MSIVCPLAPRRTLYVAALLSTLAACDAATSPQSVDPPVAPDEDPVADPGSSLSLPVLAVDRIELNEVVKDEVVDNALVRMGGTRAMVLGLGETYPADLELVPSQLYHSECYTLDGEWVVLEASSSDPQRVAAGIAQDGNVWLDIMDAGDARVTLRGQYLSPADGPCGDYVQAGTRYEVVLHLDVQVVRPHGARFSRPQWCQEAAVARVVTGAPFLHDVAVWPLDEAGDAVSFANAARNRQVGLTINPPEAGAVTAFDSEQLGVGGLVFSGAAGLASIVPDVGEPISLQVVEPAAIEDAEVEFVVPWGHGRSDLVIEAGETYNARCWPVERGIIEPRIGRMWVDGEPVCSRPVSEWFTLTTHTPETCTVSEWTTDADDAWRLFGLGVAGELVASGECELTLQADAFSGGDGFDANIRAEFQGARW